MLDPFAQKKLDDPNYILHRQKVFVEQMAEQAAASEAQTVRAAFTISNEDDNIPDGAYTLTWTLVLKRWPYEVD